MTKPKESLFISCGQRTQQEKALGRAICSLIRDESEYEPYFAEFQANLNGLNENILDALSQAAGIITILHKRGVVQDDPELSRASVWVEQEIAIAAYIQRREKKDLITAAYIEVGVAREGLRTLLHLNPVLFTSSEEVIADLRNRIQLWKKRSSKAEQQDQDDRGQLSLVIQPASVVPGLLGRQLAPHLINKGPRVKEYFCSIEIPRPLLSFTSCTYLIEVKSGRPEYRLFRSTEANWRYEPLQRDEDRQMFTIEVAILQLSSSEIARIADLPIYLSAELGHNLYKLMVDTRSVFGLAP